MARGRLWEGSGKGHKDDDQEQQLHKDALESMLGYT